MADGLVLGSPIYFGEVTGQMRAFLERLSFPWLSYNDYSRYELAGFSEEVKRQWRDAHWKEDLQKAFDTGRKMAEM